MAKLSLTYDLTTIYMSTCLMTWFHVQCVACNALQFLCNNCGLSNVTEDIHGSNILASRIFSVTLESLQLSHKKCSALHAINCT